MKPLQDADSEMKVNVQSHTLCLVMLRTWTISGVSYKKQPRPLSHNRSSLYFSYKKKYFQQKF